ESVATRSRRRPLPPRRCSFESQQAVWIALEGTPGASRGVIQRLFQNSGTWGPSNNVTLSATEPVYSVCGRTEITMINGNTVRAWVTYATTRTKLFQWNNA